MAYFTTRDGTAIRYKELGEGRPVILIHGWPLSGDSWDPVMMHLADNGMRAVAYDRRGFGGSDHAASCYDYDTFSDDLADLIAHLGLDANIGLAGFSMGGGEIARYMNRHGGKGVTAAALVSSVVPYMLQTDDNPEGVPDATFKEMTEGMKDDFRAFFTGFFKDFYGVGGPGTLVSEEERHWAWQTAMKASQYATLQSAAAFAYTDFRPDLAHITVPTLVIHGTNDKTVPIEATGRKAAAGIANAKLIEYADEPHAVFATVTDRLNADLAEFFAANR